MRFLQCESDDVYGKRDNYSEATTSVHGESGPELRDIAR